MLSKASFRRSESSLSVLNNDKHKAGLPSPSRKSKEGGADVAALLSSGEASLADYYQDSQPGHLADARRHYQAAIQQQAGCPEAHHGLAIVSDLQQDYTTAELHYRAALDGNPTDAQVLGDLGYSYLLQGKLNQSEELLKQATKSDPGNIQAFKNLAFVYGKTGRAELAEATYRRVLNETEVRQEMAQLYPQGVPETERGFFGSQDTTEARTVALRDRIQEAREQGQAEMQHSLDRATAQEMNPQQQQREALRSQAEREASQMANENQAIANAPISLNVRDTQRGGVPGPAIQPPMNGQPSMAQAPTITPAPQNGRRAQNSFYPQSHDPRTHDPRSIQQAGATQSAQGGYPNPEAERALYQTPYGVDPRTGMPLQHGMQQTGGSPLLVPEGLGGGYPNPAANSYDQRQNVTPTGPTSAYGSVNPGYEEAKRRAAMVGLAGPETMFPIIENTQRVAPGTGSALGADYPPVQRDLPTNAQPHDLQAIANAPAGQMTVPPNQLGMINSPAGPSFANPPAYQTMTPDGPAPVQSWNAGMSYQNQADAARQAAPPPYYGANGQEASTPIDNNQNNARQGVNAELYRYGETMQSPASQLGQTAWGTVNTPANGSGQQYQQPQTGGEQMRSTWNPQSFQPQMPPAYPGSPAAEAQAASYSNSQGAYQSNPDSGAGLPAHPNAYPDSNLAPAAYRQSGEPNPIYSPGARVPAPYNPQSNSLSPAGNNNGLYNGPRIRPAARDAR